MLIVRSIPLQHWRALHSHVPPNVLARSVLLLPHHNALAAVGEGNKGGSGGGESTLFSLERRKRGEFTLPRQ
jgi:hypothetical protein